MITHAEASFSVSMSVEKMFEFMRKHGHHYPVLYALNKGEPMDVSDCLNGSVISHDAEEKHLSHPEHRVYRAAIGFKNMEPEDEANIQKAADDLAKKLNPDAIALVIACIYDEFDEGDNVPKTLDADPEAFKVLHSCYWTREDPEPKVSMVPYVCMDNEGSTPKDNTDEEVNCGVSSVAFPWLTAPKKLGTKILDPYREQRK